MDNCGVASLLIIIFVFSDSIFISLQQTKFGFAITNMIQLAAGEFRNFPFSIFN